MNRRSRSLPGLLALLGLSLFLAEGVWTAACPPDSGDAAVATVADMAVGDAAPASPAADAADSEEDSGCPLGVIAIGGCVSAAVLSSAPADIPIPDAPSGSSALTEVRPDLLLASSLFRPPRA